MSRRTTVTRALAAAGLTLAATLPAVSASAEPAPAPAGPGSLFGRDQLVVTVTDSGDPLRDGTYTLRCHPVGGTHPDAKGACDGLDEVTVWGKDPFAPVAPDAHCTQVYGGSAKAHVIGRWAGRPVDARFARTDGCQMTRWDRAVPLLPRLS